MKSRRLLGVVVALLLLLALVPTVFAQTQVLELGTAADFAALNETLAAGSGLTVEAVLTADIAIEEQLTLNAGTAHNVTLDLGGHTVTAKDAAAIRFLAMFDGNVTVKNGTIEMPGINETTTDGNTGAGMGGLIFVMGDKLTLNNVTVRKTATDNMVGDGGIICLRSASAAMEMYASAVEAVKDDKPDASVGGALRVTNGAKLYMYENSAIRNGYASGYGGNIAVAGSSYLYVYDNSAITGGISDVGGNIYLGNANARFFVYHGTISDGVATKGGNINIGTGRFFFYDGTISGGTATEGQSVVIQNSKNAYFYFIGGQLLHSQPDTAFAKASSGKARFYNGKVVFDPTEWTPADCSYVTAPAEGETLYTVTHVDIEGMEVTPSTCTVAGTKSIACGTCDHSYTYTLPLAAHTEVADETVAPTCTTTGLTQGSHCSVCNEVLVAQQVIPAMQHNYSSVYTAPTFEADGFTTFTCSACGDSYQQTDEGSQLIAVATVNAVPYATLQEAVDVGGEVVLCRHQMLNQPLTINGDVTLNLNGHTLGCLPMEGYGIVVKGNLTFKGEGLFQAVGMYGIGVAVGGSLHITEGNFMGTNQNDYLIGNWGTTVIEGGSFQGVYNCVNNFAGTTEIYGGTFTTAAYDYTGEHESADILANEGLTVYGGTYSKPVDGAYLAPGYVAILNNQVVKLTDALETGFVQLQSDVVLSEKLVVNNTVTLNLNGYTLTLAETEDGYALVVKGDLTIIGEGTVHSSGVYGIGVSGTLNVSDGTFTAAAHNDYIIGNWGRTVISGGTFCGVYNCVNNFAGTTEIYGGTFTTAAYDYTGEYVSSDVLADEGLTVYGGTFSKPVAPYLTNHYYQVENPDGTYTVAEKEYAQIITQPADVTADVQTNAIFSVAAQGDGITYRWQYSRNGSTWYDTTMTGCETAQLTVPVTLSRNGYWYRCVVTDQYGSIAVSENVQLIVNLPEGLAQITAQPEAKTVVAGEAASFAVSAQGDGLTYRWQYTKNGTSWFDTTLEGCKTAQLSLTATVARNGYQYRCVITDQYGTQVTSEAAMLTVLESTIATFGPEDQVAVGGKAVFTVNAEGEGLTYRWQYQRADGTKWFNTTMEGYKTNELTVTATAARNGYRYRCVVTDAYGNETVSETATLTVE